MIKAITLTEPWASLVACGVKTIETRDWGTRYTGPIAIHAAKGMSGDALDYAIHSAVVQAALPATRDWRRRRPLVKDAFAETRGRVVAVTTLLCCLPAHTVGFPAPGEEPAEGTRWTARAEEMLVGDFTAGRYAWIFGPVYRIAQPIPATGSLGLWDWEPPAWLLTEPGAYVSSAVASDAAAQIGLFGGDDVDPERLAATGEGA